MPGAGLRGEIERTGTSGAAAIVCGVAALLLSLQLKKTGTHNSATVRDALLGAVTKCDPKMSDECHRTLAGRLNVLGAMTRLETVEGEIMSSTKEQLVGELAPSVSAPVSDRVAVSEESGSAAMRESACTCGSTAGQCSCAAGKRVQLVYPIGRLGWDFGTETRRDYLLQQAQAQTPLGGTPPDVTTPDGFYAFIDPSRQPNNFFDVTSVIWTLMQESTTIYAISPSGPFAHAVFKTLVDGLGEQNKGFTDLCAMPGILGSTVTLMNGQVVPTIIPDIRAITAWKIADIVGTHPERVANEAAQKTSQTMNATMKARRRIS